MNENPEWTRSIPTDSPPRNRPDGYAEPGGYVGSNFNAPLTPRADHVTPPAVRARKQAARLKVGAVAALAILGGGAWFAFAQPTTDSGTTPVADAFQTIEIDSAGAAVSLEYDDVSQAEVRTERVARGDAVETTVQDGRLVVHHEGRQFGFLDRTNPQIAVVLPKAMEAQSMPVLIRTEAGAIEVDGDFASVDAETQAGRVQITGRIPTVEAQSGAGRIEADVESRSVRVSSGAGRVEIAVEGALPDSVDATSQAGRVEVDVPDGSYRIDASSDAGSVEIDNSVRHDPESPRSIEAHSGAGSVDVN